MTLTRPHLPQPLRVWTDQQYREFLWASGRRETLAELRAFRISGVGDLSQHDLIELAVQTRRNYLDSRCRANIHTTNHCLILEGSSDGL